jgi:hypothetical protein
MTTKFDQRIAKLFLRGYSIDLISELGLKEGWSRRDAKAVVTLRNWALDWSGRLQPSCYEGSEIPVQVSVMEAEMEKILIVAQDHESPVIRHKADLVIEAMDDLRMTLLQEEEQEAVRAVRRSRSAAAGQDPEAPGYLHTVKPPIGAQRGSQRAGEPSEMTG